MSREPEATEVAARALAGRQAALLIAASIEIIVTLGAICFPQGCLPGSAGG